MEMLTIITNEFNGKIGDQVYFYFGKEFKNEYYINLKDVMNERYGTFIDDHLRFYIDVK